MTDGSSAAHIGKAIQEGKATREAWRHMEYYYRKVTKWIHCQLSCLYKQL